MKEKMRVGILAAAVLLSLGITAAAEAQLSVDTAGADGITVSYNGSEQCTLYAAMYENGALKNVTFSEDNTIETGVSGDEVRVFCWDEDMKPLAESVSVHAKSTDLDMLTVNGENNLEYNGEALTLADSVTLIANNTSKNVCSADETVSFIQEKNPDSGDKISFWDMNNDGKYEICTFDCYGTAVVDEISDVENPKIWFVNTGAGVGGSLKTDDEDVSYSFVFRGKEISPKELLPYDVLTIEYNPFETFNYSDYYHAVVSRKRVSGVVTAMSDDGDEYTMDGKTYSSVPNMLPELDLKEPYTFYLDIYGRVAEATVNVTERNIGILTNVYKKTDNNFYVSLIDKNGEKKEFPIDEDNASVYGLDYLQTGSWDENGTTYDKTAGTDKLNMYPNQVIQYYVDPETGIFEIMRGLSASNSGMSEYKKENGSIGIVKAGDSSVILDLTDVEDNDKARALTAENLINGYEYNAFGYETDNGKHTFIIITDAAPGEEDWPYTFETCVMAVFESKETVNEGGAERTRWTVAADGSEKYYIVSDEIAQNVSLAYGDAVIIDTDKNGEINKAIPVFSASNILGTSFDTFGNSAITNGFANILSHPSGTYWNSILPSEGKYKGDVLFGVLVDKDQNNITLCTELEDGKYINIDRGKYLYADNARIYGFNYAELANPKRNAIGTGESLMATPSVRFAMTTNYVGEDLLDITNDEVFYDVVFALARVVDDEIKDIYMIYYEE